LRALEVVGESQANVLVFGFGPADKATLHALRTLSERVVVVLAAGNEQGVSSYADIDSVALVAAAATLTGSPAPFSDSSPHAVWAPAVDIPITSPVTGQRTNSSGTSYAAAFVGGAAALLKGAYPKAKPSQVVKALQESSGPNRLLNVEAALKRLGEILGQPAGS
jgi:subtilisin family serine protease